MIEIVEEQSIAAPVQRVWELVSHHEGMPRWFPAREVVRRRPGRPEPDGVGAVRVVRTRGLALEEIVTTFEPSEGLAYTMTEGGPFSEYRGWVTLEPDATGVRVQWRVGLRPFVPGTGWALRRAVRRDLRQGLAGLRALAESER